MNLTRAKGADLELSLAQVLVVALVGIAGLAAILAQGSARNVAVATVAAVGLTALTATDLAWHRLPNQLVAGFSAAVLMAVVATLELTPVTRAVVGGFIAGAIFIGLRLVSPEGIGMGDVKLAPALGMATAFFSWSVLFYGMVASFIINGLVGGFLVAIRRTPQSGKVPFGPALALGCLIAIALV